ncbi:MAG: hypothetical protein KDD70_06475 [Bdellovibrionales bacterium]|nr:hypothetical protein [Bdellovibrionales bacterium]
MTKQITILLSLFFAFIIFSSPPLRAESPEDLTDWTSWIEDRHPEWGCAFQKPGLVSCVWPGRIQYQLDEKKGLFTIRVRMLDKGEIQIPSSAALFPANLAVRDSSGKELEVESRATQSNVYLTLPVGEFTVSGSFTWDRIPSELPIPSHYGLLDLNLSRENYNFRRGDQSVWIEEKEAGKAAEQLTISVFRKIHDTSPLQIETLLRLRVSGTNRALNIGRVILPNTTPVKSSSPLPHYLSADGSLGLQLTPGEHEVRITSVVGQPVESLQVPSLPLGEWPKEEVWAYFANSAFRSVSVKGATPVQAALTQLPTEWQGGASYIVQGGSEVHFELLRRGEQEPTKNTIALSRKFWPDLTGDGFTVQDQFSGTMNKDFRLNALSETLLGRALVNDQPALITNDPNSDLQGLELRDQQLNVTAVSRLQDRGSFPAIGWNTVVDSLNFTLHLPPSWLLFHVSGAQAGKSTWVDSWTLLDIFIALLIVLGSFKLFNWRIALVTCAILLLGHNEFIAPRIFLIYVLIFYVWRLLAKGRGRGWEIASSVCLVVTFAALTLQSLSFAKLQFIQMLFPQLQSGTRYTTFIQQLLEGIETSLFIWPYLLLLAVIVIFAVRSFFRSTGFWNFIGRAVLYGLVFMGVAVVLGPMTFSAGYLPMQSSNYYNEYDQVASSAPITKSYTSAIRNAEENAPDLQQSKRQEKFSYESKNLLSGPAVPSWQWKYHYLSIPGPIGTDYEVQFVLFPPWITRILCGLRVLAALLLIGLFFNALGYTKFLRPYIDQAAGLSILLPLALLLQPSTAHAEYPSAQLLDELEARLQQEQCSNDPCATIEDIKLDISGTEYSLKLSVSSNGRSSVSLPGPLEVMLPKKVIRNGEETISLRRSSGGYLSLQTEDGRNRFEIQGVLPLESSFSLQFETRPLYVEVNAEDWFIEGLTSSGFVRDSIRFTRKNVTADPQGESSLPDIENAAPADLPTWFEVKREITISDQIRTSLEVVRVGMLGKSVQVRIPLLEGERITSGAATVEKGALLARFGANSNTMLFGGELPYTGKLHLKASKKKNLNERWTVQCSPIMSCSLDGLKPMHSVYSGKKANVWLPFPGEEVHVQYKDLTGIKGDFLTLDETNYDIQWGAQQLSGTLTVQLRATEQTTFSITAPPKSTINSLQVGGGSGSGDVKENTGVVLLNPGEHTVSLQYSLPWQAGTVETAPPILLSAPAHNVKIQIHPSPERWILWTGGVSWGPCVLFWGKLIFIVALCVGLSLISILPMKPISAAMLGVGLTSIPIIWMTIPLAWLASLKLIPLMRDQWNHLVKPLRLFLFVGLTLLALVFFFKIVQIGLVLSPPMLVVGNQSNASALKWFVDHSEAGLPQPWVLSLPMWCWRAFALVWSTWLVLAMFSWLKLAVDMEREENS